MTKDDILDALHDSSGAAVPLVRKTDTGEVLFILEEYQTVGEETLTVVNFYKGEWDDPDPLCVHFLILNEEWLICTSEDIERPGYAEINLNKLELAGFYSPIAHDNIEEALTYPVRWIDDYSKYITD